MSLHHVHGHRGPICAYTEELLGWLYPLAYLSWTGLPAPTSKILLVVLFTAMLTPRLLGSSTDAQLVVGIGDSENFSFPFK